ncbi:MAG: nucleoside deaminase [Bacteroidales bacterium]|nr:nucleoside deaminase [Bacteroidales bacterium]
MNHDLLMKEAIDLSIKSVENGGGPFGAVITKNGEIISKSVNRVTKDNDPTAHAEILAIREAAKQLKTFDLSGCTIYCSCEPCPMCFGAIYWARIDKIFYACNRYDVNNHGFDDEHLYKEIKLPTGQREISFSQLLRKEAMEAFKKWDENDEKIVY